MQQRTEELLASYVDALRPIIYINHFDATVVDDMIRSISQGVKIHEFNNALGAVSFQGKAPMREYTLEVFLKQCMDDGYDGPTFLVLKDIHHEIEQPRIVALLKYIAEKNLAVDGYYCTIFVVSPKIAIPLELEKYITIVDFPLPQVERIREIIDEFARDLSIEVQSDTKNEKALSFKGLHEFQIKQILNLAYQNGGTIDSSDKALILKEKEQFVKKSGMLEIVNFKETIHDIGGLENLKEWLSRKAKIFQNLDRAMRFGVDIPKGIMIIGMPGCGKSLTAKATADLFHIPLVRLDVGRLMGKYVGESEENMRRALQLSEAISPCVLWIDEIEKAFAGIGGNSSNDVTTRLFGQFLTWMQEKENTVFIVATANDISQLPPEFLRKGRFDELFFVDLPNSAERRKILEIHLRKRRKWSKEINLFKLMQITEGFNGADLEAVVKDTIERAFIEGELPGDKERSTITTDDLRKTIEETKSISNTLKEKMERLREKIKNMDIKNASRDDNKRS